MLVVTRNVGESIMIKPHADADLSMTLGELFADGAIEVVVVRGGRSRIRLGIAAPQSLLVWRTDEDT